MKSLLAPSFVSLFRELPPHVKSTARKNYKLWKENPAHPSIAFKKLEGKGDFYSVRIGLGWRALSQKIERDGESVVLWFWVGSHADYDKLISTI